MANQAKVEEMWTKLATDDEYRKHFCLNTKAELEKCGIAVAESDVPPYGPKLPCKEQIAAHHALLAQRTMETSGLIIFMH